LGCTALTHLTVRTFRQVVPQFQSADAFGKFSAAISKVVSVQTETLAAVDIVAMYASLMAFALQARACRVCRARVYAPLTAVAAALRCTASS
jgi:hypothetical protein